jgi:hypothetical protein
MGFARRNVVWDDARGVFKLAPGRSVGTITSPIVAVGTPFDQLIPSWNAVTPPGSCVTILAQVKVGEKWSRWLRMAVWHRDGQPPERTTIADEGDDQAKTDVDALAAKHPATAFRVKAELTASATGASPTLRRLVAHVFDLAAEPKLGAAGSRIGPVELPVPEISQLSIAGGHAFCSACSTTMALAYWSAAAHRPELKASFADVAAGTFDRGYGGTGNWTFNTAFAAEFGGLVAYVDRFDSIARLKPWLDAKVPIIASLDRNVLTHGGKQPMGHLVVVRGFTGDGRIILNDPWAHLDKGEHVRQVYPVADFEQAWLTKKGSCGIVYVIYPEGWAVPRSE